MLPSTPLARVATAPALPTARPGPGRRRGVAASAANRLLPTDTIATWYADAGFAISSIRVDLAAIRPAHLLAELLLDLRDPRLAMVIEGVLIPAQPHSSLSHFPIFSFPHDVPIVRRAPGRSRLPGSGAKSHHASNKATPRSLP